MNEGVLARSCTEQGPSPPTPPSLFSLPFLIPLPPPLVSDNLETFRNDVVLSDTVDCYYDFGTISWFVEPCCNVFLSVRFENNFKSYPYNLSQKLTKQPSLSLVVSPLISMPLSTLLGRLLTCQIVVSQSVPNHIMTICHFHLIIWVIHF